MPRSPLQAFFKSPRPLEGVQQVLRPLAAAVRPPRRWQAAHAAVIPEEEAERGAGAEEAAGLQHAVAIEPVLPQEVADSLDAMLAAADLRSGVRSSHSMAALQTLRLAGRQQSQCDAEGARLSALARELAAVQQHVQLQAGLLAECRARTAGARQQARQVQARLARSQARAATVEQEETEMRAATEQERQQAAQQVRAAPRGGSRGSTWQPSSPARSAATTAGHALGVYVPRPCLLPPARAADRCAADGASGADRLHRGRAPPAGARRSRRAAPHRGHRRHGPAALPRRPEPPVPLRAHGGQPRAADGGGGAAARAGDGGVPGQVPPRHL